MTDRPRERWLLGRAGALIVLLYVGLALHRQRAGLPAVWPAELLALLGLAACLTAIHRGLCGLGIRGDEAIVPIVGLLTGLGLILRLRLAEPPLDFAGLVELAPYPLAALALLGAVWICRERLHWLDRAAWTAGLLAVGVMALLLRQGVHFRGAMYGPGLTTPSELLKVLLVVFLAGFLKHRRGPGELLAFGLIWGGVLALLAKQSDLGMVVILSALLLSLFYVATGRVRFLLIGLASAALLGLALYYAPLGIAGGRGQQRLEIWLHPWRTPMGAGYQTLQALFAIRAGGWVGLGPGGGHPELIPLVSSDFAYAALAEELGLLGSGAVLLLYVALFRRGYRIALLADEPFRQRLAIGCVTVLAIQTLINVGGVVRLAPITGITLPFVSHGGSSLVVSSILVGLVLAVGHDVESDERHEQNPWRRPRAVARGPGADGGRRPGRNPRSAGPPRR